MQRAITEEQRTKILALHEKGLSAKQISDHLKATGDEVADWAVAVVTKTRNYRAG